MPSAVEHTQDVLNLQRPRGQGAVSQPSTTTVSTAATSNHTTTSPLLAHLLTSSPRCGTLGTRPCCAVRQRSPCSSAGGRRAQMPPHAVRHSR